MQEHVSEPQNELASTPFKRGKVKDIYELGNEELLFVFTDRVSAYDVVLPSTIPRKGEVLCKLAAFWFDYLKVRSEEHTSELQSRRDLVCRLLLVKKNIVHRIRRPSSLPAIAPPPQATYPRRPHH